MIDGADPLLGKVPGEKFIRYLEMKLMAEDSQIDKLRMKTASIKAQLKRILTQLTQKEELGKARKNFLVVHLNRIKSDNAHFASQVKSFTPSILNNLKLKIEIVKIALTRRYFT